MKNLNQLKEKEVKRAEALKGGTELKSYNAEKQRSRFVNRRELS